MVLIMMIKIAVVAVVKLGTTSSILFFKLMLTLFYDAKELPVVDNTRYHLWDCVSSSYLSSAFLYIKVHRIEDINRVLKQKAYMLFY